MQELHAGPQGVIAGRVRQEHARNAEPGERTGQEQGAGRTVGLARGRIDVPLDAVVRLVGQTRGGHVFLSGHCEQEGQPTHSFTGTLKRVTRPNAPAQDDDRPRR